MKKILSLFALVLMSCMGAWAEVKINETTRLDLATLTVDQDYNVVIFAGGNGGYQSYIKWSGSQYTHNNGTYDANIIDGTTDRTAWTFVIRKNAEGKITIKDNEGKYWSKNAGNVTRVDDVADAALFSYEVQDANNKQYKLSYVDGEDSYNIVRNAGPVAMTLNGTNWVYATFYTYAYNDPATFEDGEIISLKNKQHNFYLSVYNNQYLSGTTTKDVNNYWQLVAADGGFKLYNNVNHYYASPISSRNGRIAVTTDANAAGIYGIEAVGTYYALNCKNGANTGHTYFHGVDWTGQVSDNPKLCVVDWDKSADASQWVLEKETPISNTIEDGVYEIKNVSNEGSNVGRGYLVDYTGFVDGPAIADCPWNDHRNNHPTAKNGESTCSYWYVNNNADGSVYIFSLSSLGNNTYPKFLKLGVQGAEEGKIAKWSEDAPMKLEIVASSYSNPIATPAYAIHKVGGADNEYLSMGCGTNSNAGAIKLDAMTDGGAPLSFVRYTGELTTEQAAIKELGLAVIAGTMPYLADARTNVSTIAEKINANTIGYPVASNDRAVALVATNPVSRTNYSTAAEALANIYGVTEINLPEAGKAYRMALVGNNGTKKYIQVSGNAGDEASAAEFVCGKDGEKFIFVLKDGSKFMNYQGANSALASYNAEYNSFTIQPLATSGSTQLGSSTAADRFGYVYMTSAKRANGNNNAGCMLVNQSTGAYDNSSAPFFNGTFTSAITFEEVANDVYVKLTNPNVGGTSGLDGKYVGTFSAPYHVTLPTGVKAYTAAISGSTVNFTELGTSVPANTGVLLYAESADADINENAVPVGTATAAGANAFAAMIDGTINAGDYVLGNGTNGVGFYARQTATTAKNKAYIPGSAGSNLNAFRFDFEDTVTGIEAVESNTNATIFDLQGRRVQSAKNGLYIVNGKKVIR